MAAQAEALCRAAADVLRRSNKGEGVRQILYSVQLPASTKPQLQAIVLGAQKDESLIWDVAKRSGIMDMMPATHVTPDDRLLLVLLYEALLGSRRVRGNADIFTFVKNHKADLQRCLAELRKKGTVEKFQEKIRLPRYARVNTLKTSMDAVLTHFRGRGWKVDMGRGDVHPSSGGSLVSPSKGTIIADPVLPDIIAFPAGTSLHADPLVYSGAVILQDRSSCLSAIALLPLSASARVADACAAPGNKTSHAAMLLARARSEKSKEDAEGGEKEGGEGVCVLAYERDTHREKMLRMQMAKLGCDRYVRVNGRDFTEAAREARREDTEEGEKGALWGVTHVLCDPSCSGSGLVAQYHGQKGGVRTGEEGGMAENDVQEGGSGKEELKAFAAEQSKIVCAALSLPNVEVVVYSTCSVHKEENEEVVAQVLKNCKGRARQVAVLPDWPHRGLPTEGCDGSMCARASHDKDCTNGFFVARFETKRAGAEGARAAVGKKREREEDGEQVAGSKAKKGAKTRKSGGGKEEGGGATPAQSEETVVKRKGGEGRGVGEETAKRRVDGRKKATAPEGGNGGKGKKGGQGGKEGKGGKGGQGGNGMKGGKGGQGGKEGKGGKGGQGRAPGLEAALAPKQKGAAWRGAIDVD